MSAKNKPDKSPNAAPEPVSADTDNEVIHASLLERFWRLAKQENELPKGKSNPKLTSEIDRIQSALRKIRSEPKVAGDSKDD